MPIVFQTTFAAGNSVAASRLTVSFVATDAAGAPLANTAFMGVKLYGTMIQPAPPPPPLTGTTNTDGVGTLDFYTLPVQGNVGLIQITVGTGAAAVVGQHVIGIFNPAVTKDLIVGGAYVVEPNVWRINASLLASNGVRFRAQLPPTGAIPAVSSFIGVGAYLGFEVEVTGSTQLFSVRPTNQYFKPPYPPQVDIIWGAINDANNVYVPNVATLIIEDDDATGKLEAVQLQTATDGYINIIDNLFGFPFVIPDDTRIAVGNTYTLRYSTTGVSGSYTSLATGPLDALPFTGNIAAQAFAAVPNGTEIWFVYTVTTTGGLTYESIPASAVLAIE